MKSIEIEVLLGESVPVRSYVRRFLTSAVRECLGYDKEEFGYPHIDVVVTKCRSTPALRDERGEATYLGSEFDVIIKITGPTPPSDRRSMEEMIEALGLQVKKFFGEKNEIKIGFVPRNQGVVCTF